MMVSFFGWRPLGAWLERELGMGKASALVLIVGGLALLIAHYFPRDADRPDRESDSK